MAGVALERVTRVFDGGVVAVRDLDLEARDGELLVIVGPSGSGKTTVLRIIAGLESPTSGRVRIGDRDVTDVPPADRDIAMVFQNYALYPHMSVRDNLSFGLRVRKTPKPEIARRMMAVAERLGLDTLLDRKPAALSGGQRQRVALGRALVREPSVFLFDEPLSNLDARLRVETRAELARLHRALGTTMVYVTHGQVEAMTLGQRIAVLDGGVLQQSAPPPELYLRPANLFVATFIGSPAMNLFRGRLDRNDQPVRFIAPAMSVAVETPPPAGDEVVLGIRPEHLVPAGADFADLTVQVDVVEPIGAETLVYGPAAGGGRVAVRIAGPTRIGIDDSLCLRADSSALHWFDPSTGRSLA
ncbi:MAG: sn-glycerol-3-phosphate ABC transporter ATP-binding protein UgpC [Gemmatimonadetes bacterium]|nr:sn-glycerol-3-phosphate ABC transporter ATP-binding protein UgpC [Gemmatimonadota bacterium]